MVLARKYRPRGFDSMVGQGHVVQALSNALTQQRLHHAYLFTGTRGVGKTTVSRILAKALNCVGPDGTGGITASPCGHCQPCRDIDAGRFVDYVELDAASNRGVEEISQLLEQAVYKPVVGRFKVYMIDEVHMLSTTAFNAMLKTLEEPPEYLKFVLATTDPQKVPVTVLSRCLQFNLRPMPAQAVQEHLGLVLQAEGIDHDAGSLRLLGRAARGSMRDAMSLTDQAIAFGSGRLEEGVVRQMLGAVDRQHVQRIIEAVSAGDGAALVAAVNQLRELGLSAAGTLEELASALQRLAVIQMVGEVEDPSDPDADVWRHLAPSLAPDETQLFYSLCVQGRAELALAPDEYAGLLMLLLRLLAFKPGQVAGSPPPKAAGPVPRSAPVTGPETRSPAAPIATVAPVSPLPAASPVTPPQVAAPAPAVRAAADDQAPPPWVDAPIDDEAPAVQAPDPDPEPDAAPPQAVVRPAPAPAPAPAPVSAPVSAPAPAPSSLALPVGASAASLLTDDPLSERWADLVQRMASGGLIAALVRELAMQAQCVAQREEGGRSVWVLQVERESLLSDTNRDRLHQALTQVLERKVTLELRKGPAVGTPAQREQAAREARQQQAEQLIQADPRVRQLLQSFPEARVVAGSIRPL